MQKRIFVVPEGTLSAVVQGMLEVVISSIPDDWAWMSGSLSATKNMIERGEVLASTKWVFGSLISQMIDRIDYGHGHRAEIFRSLIEGMLPAEVQFGGSFSQAEVLSTEEKKLFAIHFIEKGYRGRVNWRYCDVDGDPHRNSHYYHDCELWLPTQDENELPEVRVEWGNDATEARHKPILDVCEKLKLKEFQPK